MGTTTRALPAFEVTVRGRGAALAGRELVGVHSQAHRAAGTTPLGTCRLEDLVQTLGLGMVLDVDRARNNQQADPLGDPAPTKHVRGGPKVLKPTVGARPD